MIEVYNVTSIYAQIVGYAEVCYPIKDANDNYILSQSSLSDGLLQDIHSLISECELIEYAPKQITIPPQQ
jgi:hypothetical protein